MKPNPDMNGTETGMLEGRIIVCPRVESSAPGTVPLSLLPWNYQGQDPPRPDWQSCQTRRTREVPSLMDWLVVFSLLFLDYRAGSSRIASPSELLLDGVNDFDVFKRRSGVRR